VPGSLDAVRRAVQDAENAGDVHAIIALFTDDAVAMVPTSPVLEGRDACGAFVRETLAGLLEIFERRVDYASAEATELGDIAYDRGTFTITCISREDGSRHDATGKYFWLLRRESGDWRIARLIHAVDELAEAPDRAPESFETARLLLRRPHVSDAPEIFARYASDSDVTRYLSWPTHQTLADTEAFIAFSDRQWAERGVGPYLIRSREDHQLIGSTGLDVDANGRATTGYVIAKDAWGRGYATEALRAMVALAADLGLSSLSALCLAEHAASSRVLEKCSFAMDETWSEPALFPNLSAGESRGTTRWVIEL